MIRKVGIVVIVCAALLVACTTATKDSSTGESQPPSIADNRTNQAPNRKLFVLSAEEFWRLDLPEGRRFDASGLAWDGNRLLVVDDRQPEIYQVEFGGTNAAKLRPTGIFSWNQMTPFLGSKRRHFDFEGLARDEQGRIFVCEESTRSIFRWEPATRKVERLEIDWAPVRQYFSSDDNASFEGIAIGGGKLWLANERDRARLIEVDLQTLKVVGDFAPQPSTWSFVLHYSDLCWFKGHLFLLLRHHRVILEIDPTTRDVLAEYNYRAMEEAPEHRYHKEFPTGTMEGLAVDDQYFWLVTDNNGFGRQENSTDRRPTLFKCKRPN